MRRQKNKKKTNPVFFKKYLEKINLFFLSVFIFFLPSQLGKHFFLDFSYLNGVRVDYLAPTFYLTDLFFIIILCLNLQKIKINFFNKKFLFFILISVFNFFVAKNKFVFVYFYLRLLEVFFVYLIFKKSSFPLKLFLYLITASGLIQLLLVIGQFITHHSIQGPFYFLGERFFSLSTPAIAKTSIQGKELLRPYGTFSHPNSLAGFFCLLYFFVLSKKGFKKFYFSQLIFLLISSLLIFFSFSKIAILTFLILNFLFLIKKDKKCFICFISRYFIIVFLSLFFLSVKNDPLSLKKRLFLLNSAIQLIKKNFVFGVGAGHYLISQHQLSLAKIYFDMVNQPVHNIFLLFFAEWGIFSFFFFFVVFQELKKIREVFFVIFVIFTTGFFDHYWLTLIQNQILLGVIFGLL